jgi:hypothetical protein
MLLLILKFYDIRKPYIKRTVQLDIGFHFRFCKIKSVHSGEPLRIFKFEYFIFPEIFKLNCLELTLKMLINSTDFLKSC